MSALLAFSAAGVSSAENIGVEVNGQTVECTQPPIIYNDRVLIPLRDVFNAVGAEVGWNENTYTAVGVKGRDIVKVTIDDDVIYKNGTPVKTDAPAKLVNGSTMVPVRAVAEAFGCGVEWDGNNVLITSEVSHNAVLTDFLENRFEDTLLEIRGDAMTPLFDDTGIYYSKSKIHSHAFFDIDGDGEEELIVSSIPDEESPELAQWWEGKTICLSIWKCGEDGVPVNIFAKSAVYHRMSYKQNIAVFNGKICLCDLYNYGSSGERWRDVRVFAYENGDFKKTKEIICRESYDYIDESEYNRQIAEGIQTGIYVDTYSNGEENRVRFAYDTEYRVDGVQNGREDAVRALNDFESDAVIIFNPFSGLYD